MPNSKNWLDQLKPGDKVAINRGSHFSPFYEILVVERITRTGQIVAGTHRFMPNGKMMGRSSYYSCWLEPVTSKIIEAIEMRNITLRFQKLVDNINNSKITLTHHQYKKIVDTIEDVIKNEQI